jgi:hypothetical protein
VKKQIVTLFFLLGANAASGAERPADYAFGIPLEADGKEALYDVTLPVAVYRGVVRADLGDLRVFNGAGEVVPYALRPRRMTDTETAPPVALTLFPLKAEEGAALDAISIRVRRSAGGKSSIDVTSTGRRAGGEKRIVRCARSNSTGRRCPTGLQGRFASMRVMISGHGARWYPLHRW